MTALLSDAELLAKLVSLDSTSHNNNLPIVDFICNYLDDPRITLIRQLSPDGDKANVIAWREGDDAESGAGTRAKAAGGAPGLVLSGHLDVVPASEPQWQSDPFQLTEKEDLLIGRGACDMKGFVALALNRVCTVVDQPLTAPLAVLLTYDEEVGMHGAQQIVEARNGLPDLPTSVIVGEPTSLRVVRMHKGHLAMRITVRGRSAHSAQPSLGINAIEPAARIITALADLRTAMASERVETSEFFPETPFVTLNIAQVRGGEAVNIVPDRCEIYAGVRILPGMDSKAAAERVRRTVESVDDRGDSTVEVLYDSPPMLLGETSETYRRLCELVSQTETVSVAYATDAGVLQKAGLECALLGPGSIEVAHKPNESLPKAEFFEAGRLLDRAIHAFCHST